MGSKDIVSQVALFFLVFLRYPFIIPCSQLKVSNAPSFFPVLPIIKHLKEDLDQVAHHLSHFLHTHIDLTVSYMPSVVWDPSCPFHSLSRIFPCASSKVFYIRYPATSLTMQRVKAQEEMRTWRQTLPLSTLHTTIGLPFFALNS